MKSVNRLKKTAALLAVLFVFSFSSGLIFSSNNYAAVNPLETSPLAGLEKTIFLDLRDINVVDVFKFLAAQGSLNIVTSKNVQGRSTLTLRKVKIIDAIDILVISNQLAYEIKGDIIYIMTEEEFTLANGKTYNDKKKVLVRELRYAKPSYVLAALQATQSALGKIIIDEETGTVLMIDTNEKLMQMNSLLDKVETRTDTEVVKLEHATAKDLETQLKPQVDGKGIGALFADERSNQIVINAYPDRMKQILPVIKALDKRKKAVLVEGRILQLTLNPRFNYGINWQKVFGRASKDFKLTGTYPIDSSITTSFQKIALGKLDEDKAQAEITALKEVEDTKVLANPRVMILDRQEAKINIGDRIPYVVTTSTGSGNNVSVSEDIKFIDVGIILSVTPTISDNGFVIMKIRPEISSRTGTLTTPTNNQIPLVNTTYVDSSVIVQDGVSVILGGLIRDEVTRLDKGFPYLMDVPYIGNFFKSKKQSVKKVEIVIIITPHIISGEVDVLDKPLPILTETNNIFDPKRLQPTINKKAG